MKIDYYLSSIFSRIALISSNSCCNLSPFSFRAYLQQAALAVARWLHLRLGRDGLAWLDDFTFGWAVMA